MNENFTNRIIKSPRICKELIKFETTTVQAYLFLITILQPFKLYAFIRPCF